MQPSQAGTMQWQYQTPDKPPPLAPPQIHGREAARQRPICRGEDSGHCHGALLSLVLEVDPDPYNAMLRSCLNACCTARGSWSVPCMTCEATSTAAMTAGYVVAKLPCAIGRAAAATAESASTASISCGTPSCSFCGSCNPWLLGGV